MSKNAIHGIDLFSGAGGLSLGALRSGIAISHAYEIDRYASATFSKNHPDVGIHTGDLRNTVPPARKRYPLILMGGPPCQGFSTSNQRTRSTFNPKNWLFEEFLRFTKALNPEIIVLENVHGIRETAGGYFETTIVEKLDSLGYDVKVWVLNAVDFGVPQKRQRVFIIGAKGKLAIEPPSPVAERIVTVRQAIADLPVLNIGSQEQMLSYRASRPSLYATLMRNGLKKCDGHLVTNNNETVAKRYSFIPQGGNWTSIPKSLMQNYTNLESKRSRHSGIYRRLSWEQPSVVIANFRKNMLVHPEQNRGLSIREAARIQSFPDNFTFQGSIGQQQQQISNAVPPLLAQAVFQQIVKHF